MNTARNHERLNDLSREIARIDGEVLEAERSSNDLHGTEHEQDVAAANVIAKKADLEKKLRAYWIESEVIRRAEQTARRAAAA